LPHAAVRLGQHPQEMRPIKCCAGGPIGV
jgi:hypothetical protein